MTPLDARMQSALHRNLHFAALRATIAAEFRAVVKHALWCLQRAAEARKLRCRMWATAEARAPRGACARAIACWISYSAAWRQRLARARKHSTLSCKMRAMQNFRAVLQAARRAQRAARRRAERQQRTLLHLHARLLLMRWRMDHGELQALERHARSAWRVGRLRGCMASWRDAQHAWEDRQALSRRATAVFVAMTLSGCMHSWHSLSLALRAARRMAKRSRMHGRRIALRASLTAWWVRHQAVSRHARRLGLTRRAANTWWRLVEMRRSQRELPLIARTCLVRVMRRRGWRAWKRADARRLALAAVAVKESRVAAAWARPRLIAATSALSAHAASRRHGRRLTRWAGMLYGRRWMKMWREAHDARRQQRDARREKISHALALSAPRARSATLLAWALTAQPLAKAARTAFALAATRTWRRAATALAGWRYEISARSHRRDVARQIAIRHADGLPTCCALWRRFARVRRRISMLASRVRSILIAGPAATWYEFAQDAMAWGACAAAASAQVLMRRRMDGWARWLQAHVVESRVSSRLWALRLTFTSERRTHLLIFAVYTWRVRSRSDSRRRRWVAVGDGHYLLARQLRALRSWYHFMRRRLDAFNAQPTPLSATVPPLRALQLPPPSPPTPPPTPPLEVAVQPKIPTPPRAPLSVRVASVAPPMPMYAPPLSCYSPQMAALGFAPPPYSQHARGGAPTIAAPPPGGESLDTLLDQMVILGQIRVSDAYLSV